MPTLRNTHLQDNEEVGTALFFWCVMLEASSRCLASMAAPVKHQPRARLPDPSQDAVLGAKPQTRTTRKRTKVKLRRWAANSLSIAWACSLAACSAVGAALMMGSR